MVIGALLLSGTTRVRAASFSAELPGQWQRRDAATYASGDDVVYFTVAAPAGEPPDRVAVRIADMRRKLVNDLARGRAKLSPMMKRSNGARTIVSFGGEDPQNGKRLSLAVIAFPDVIVTVALYRPLSASSDGFDNLARSIVSSVRNEH